IMRENGIKPEIVRAGHANLFLSPVFQQSFAGSTGVGVELYENDGSVGAALGAGLGIGIYRDRSEAFSGLKKRGTIEPSQVELYENDCSVGAALGAGLGIGIYRDRSEAFSGLKKRGTIEPSQVELYNDLYEQWKKSLEYKLSI